MPSSQPEQPTYSPDQVRELALENMRLQIHNKIIQYLTLTNRISNKEEYRFEILEIVELVLSGCMRTQAVDWRQSKNEAQSLITGEGLGLDEDEK